MSARATAVSILALGVLGTGAWTAWRLSQGEPVDLPQNPPTTNSGGGVESKPTLAPVLMKGDALPPKPQHSPRDTSGMTRLPDGSYIPNLNGVRIPMVWSRPGFSPIVGIRRTDRGVDWWVHENGTQSTTVVTDAFINGVWVRQPGLQVAVPLAKTMPIAPRHLPKTPPPTKN